MVNETTKSIDLSWSLPQGQVFSFLVYKSVNGGRFSLLKTIENGACVTWSDQDIVTGNQYAYKIKYVLQSGIHGLPTNELIVVF